MFISKKKRKEIKAMYNAGHGITAIAEAVGISERRTYFYISTEIIEDEEI